MIATPSTPSVVWVRLPVWIAEWEIGCCWPDAVVGELWEAPGAFVRQAAPWWSELGTVSIPESVRTLGRWTVVGTIVEGAPDEECGVMDVSGLRLPILGPVEPGPLTAEGVYQFDAHGGFVVAGVENEDAAGPVGVVQRVLGIEYVWSEADGGVPIGQKAPVELTTTRGAEFWDFLVDLELYPEPPG